MRNLGFAASRWRCIVAAIGLLLLSYPSIAVGRSVIDLGRVTLELPPSAGVGKAQAGLLCLPSGRLRVQDFVANEDDLAARVTVALAQYAPANWSAGGTLSIRLDHISATLCAKKYGVMGRGDRRSLSGRASFSFSWVLERGSGLAPLTGREKIELRPRGTTSKTADALLGDAVRELFSRIVAKQGGTTGVN